ncbi:MAG: thiamine pyrophosphate-dependent dehydrogenase E1 component subunit alpha [Proteobacteria bacterium]|nr:thiamine pyrophosphate-dependent dehydrogenase E1 component subunit alpha [Pseudomonadota bacterium]
MKEEAIYRRLFRTALLIRLVEERIIDLYPSDRIQSPVHLSIGQESVAVGVCDGLRPDDIMFATYRSHGFYIAKGGPLDAMFAELYGRKGGISGGKAGSMHLSAPEVGLLGSSAVVASSLPHAVGTALSFKRRGLSRIAVTVFGDGATEEGVYHESLNFAAVMKVPVLFICEDNGLAVHSHRPVRQSYRLPEHAAAYGIKSRRLEEGWDIMAVRQATLEAAEKVRAGEPFVLEIVTSRYKEHVGVGEDFHFNYRSSDSVEAFKKRDPLLVDTKLVEALTPEIMREIDAAVAFAEASPAPGRAELLTDVI